MIIAGLKCEDVEVAVVGARIRVGAAEFLSARAIADNDRSPAQMNPFGRDHLEHARKRFGGNAEPTREMAFRNRQNLNRRVGLKIDEPQKKTGDALRR